MGIILIFLTALASGEAAENLGKWNTLLTKEVEEKRAEHVILSDKVEKTYIDIVTTLTDAIEARDNYTSEHSDRIVLLAKETARIFEKDDAFLECLLFSAMLHDVGKIGVPDHILNKPTSLTKEERAVIETHPIIGEKIVSNIEGLKDVASIIRSHHEKFDGTGYPDGLSGEEIPLAARIIAVVDVYTAIIDKRPYKTAKSSSDAIQIIIKKSGKHFDPQVVDAFLSAIQLQQFSKNSDAN